MRRSLLFLTVFWPLILLTACAAGTPVHTRVHQIDSGRTLVMEPGDTLEIVLDGNPTTGYSWSLEPWDTGVIEETGQPVYRSGSDAIGAGGQYTFYFRASSPGQTILRFMYHRPFEKDTPPIKRFDVHITVLRTTVPYS